LDKDDDKIGEFCDIIEEIIEEDGEGERNAIIMGGLELWCWS